eukprot:6567586-Prymnesium_polylepis.2
MREALERPSRRGSYTGAGRRVSQALAACTRTSRRHSVGADTPTSPRPAAAATGSKEDRRRSSCGSRMGDDQRRGSCEPIGEAPVFADAVPVVERASC